MQRAAHVTKIQRKPEGIGIEYKALADGYSGVTINAEVMGGVYNSSSTRKKKQQQTRRHDDDDDDDDDDDGDDEGGNIYQLMSFAKRFPEEAKSF